MNRTVVENTIIVKMVPRVVLISAIVRWCTKVISHPLRFITGFKLSLIYDPAMNLNDWHSM